MHPTLTTRQHSAAKFFLLTLLIIALDQLSKYLVNSYMQFGLAGEIPIFGQWAKLTYTLNPGMAFGAELPAPYGKLALTAFRMLAVGGLIYYIIRLCRQRVAAGYIACMALILGGAVGNLIDSIFYGIIYNNAPVGSPTRWFYGQVIDMIYVPLYVGYFPKSWPLIGGSYSSGFPIFNIADSSIFIGVVLILLNQSRFFNESQPAVAPHPESAPLVAPDAEKLA
ncbi:lipoprotein signal peptidase [Hymenobacter terrigena]